MFAFPFLLILAMAFTPLSQRIEQRVTIKFLQKHGQTVVQIWNALVQIYSAAALGRTQVRFWFNHVKAGDMQTSTKDLPRAGWPCRHLRHVPTIQRLLANDSRLFLEELSEQSGLSRSSVHCLLKKDLKLTCLSAKFVPRILSQEQKDHQVCLCRENL